MNHQVIISPEAAADLDSQLVYLLELDSEAARRLQKAVFNAFQILVASPEIGVSRGFMSARFKDLRMWPVPGFPLLLIYCVPRLSGPVEIVRLLHARQDRDSVLGDEGISRSRDRWRHERWPEVDFPEVISDQRPVYLLEIRRDRSVMLRSLMTQAKQLGYDPRSAGLAVVPTLAGD